MDTPAARLHDAAITRRYDLRRSPLPVIRPEFMDMVTIIVHRVTN